VTRWEPLGVKVRSPKRGLEVFDVLTARCDLRTNCSWLSGARLIPVSPSEEKLDIFLICSGHAEKTKSCQTTYVDTTGLGALQNMSKYRAKRDCQ
jgi:hypothetical protein